MRRKSTFWGVILALFLYPGLLSAQESDWRTLSDTSYFKEGQDDWNLLEAVFRSDPAALYFLLNRGADPDARAEGGMSALMYAAEGGDSLMVKLLVVNGADLEYNEVENTTALLVAVLNRRFQAAHILLEAGADPNHRDDYKASPLIYAAALNDFQMADLLLYYGADPEIRDRLGNDALMTAVTLGHIECADVLLQNNLPADSRDKKKRTPLMIAAQQGNVAMARMLMEYGAGLDNTDENNYTALAHAVRMERDSVIRMLVDSSASINHKINGKTNIYDLSMQQGDLENSKFLKERGAGPSPGPDFSEVDFHWGNSFNGSEYMMQVRLDWVDRKFGYFLESGVDFRPFLRRFQWEQNDSLIWQVREQRWCWTFGGGKYFTLARDEQGINYGLYAKLDGLLSFASWQGIAEKPDIRYRLAVGAGVFMRGELLLARIGTERYNFGSIYEQSWKMNISLGIRIPYKRSAYDYKEITY